jgi:hypothetical protein
MAQKEGPVAGSRPADGCWAGRQMPRPPDKRNPAVGGRVPEVTDQLGGLNDGTYSASPGPGRGLRSEMQPSWASPAATAVRKPIDFASVNAAAKGVLPALLKRWLPERRLHGHEYGARDPNRVDSGRFSINLMTEPGADDAGPEASSSRDASSHPEQQPPGHRSPAQAVVS